MSNNKAIAVKNVDKYAVKYFDKAMNYIAEHDPELLAKWVQEMEDDSKYDNYVTEDDALRIVAEFSNSDGTEGAKWTPDKLFEKVTRMGGTVDCMPAYNKWALWVTMNMESSDHDAVLQKWTRGDADRYAEACYDLAVSQLTDQDRPQWIRHYFN